MKNYDQDAYLRRITIAEKIGRRITASIFAVSVICFALSAYDMYMFLHAGDLKEGYRDFGLLLEINPDTVAWISMDNTNIDHPVVRGGDNYEYLSKDFSGADYAGGCIFLDARCAKDLSDEYLIIHGHNIMDGAMFGDLGKYLDEKFFRKNRTGKLLTPECVYELTVTGAGIADAYDSEIYYAGHERRRPLELLSKCMFTRNIEFKDSDKLLVLSTCSGDMTDNRTIVLCRARMTKDSSHERAEEKTSERT